MKKTVATIALALGLTLVAAPAHAAPPKDCITYWALPDSCLDQATADYIQDQGQQIGTLINENADLRVNLWKAAAERNEALLFQHIAEDDLADAYVRIDRLRAKVRHLRQVIASLG